MNAKKESENDTKIKYIKNIFKLCSTFLDELNITSNAEKNTAKNIPICIGVLFDFSSLPYKSFIGLPRILFVILSNFIVYPLL